MADPESELSSNRTLLEINHYMTDDHLAKVKLFTIYAEVGQYHDVEKADSIQEIYRLLESAHKDNAAPFLKHMLLKAGVPVKHVQKFKPSISPSGVQPGFLEFGSLIVDIINDLSSTDFRDLKYLIPDSQLGVNPSKIGSAVDLFRKLNYLEVLTAGNLATWDDLAQWLDAIHRKDLGEMVRKFKRRREGIVPTMNSHLLRPVWLGMSI